jgi:galactokinase
MSNLKQILNEIKNSKKDKALSDLYGAAELKKQKKRYILAVKKFDQLFSRNMNNISIFSAPGRTELAGNHTDHNHGKVLAAGIQLDSIGIVSPTNDLTVTVYSKGYLKPFTADLIDLMPQKNEISTTGALIRGIAKGLTEAGFRVGGFNAYIDSMVLPGSGLSSSASIEVLIAAIFNFIYNESRISNLQTALASQFAENKYFGKPCGLMDQIACAFGGIVSIDFKDSDKPVISKINYNFEKAGFCLVVVNTGKGHEDLTGDYAGIFKEMKSVAQYFKKSFCRFITRSELNSGIKNLRSRLGDRAVLRALHFINENERVERQVQALRRDNIDQYLKSVNESGNSSFKYLQNSYSLKNFREQGLSLALCLTENFLKDKGACRVHGGGFAGTIQAYIPASRISEYIRLMESVFGKNSACVLKVREIGTVKVI